MSEHPRSFTAILIASVTFSAAGCSGKSSTGGATAPPPPFTTSSVPGLKLWLKADGITGATDGTTLGTWPDSSGNAADAGQSNASYQPLYKATVINGLPVVRFGGAQYLTSSALPATGAAGRTVVAVVDNVTLTGDGYNHVLHWGTAFSNYQCYGLVVRCNPTQTGTGGANMGNHYWEFGLSTPDVARPGPMLIETSYDGAVDTFYLNGAAGGTDAVTLNTGTTGVTIGSRVDATTEFLTGDIAEVLIFGPNLSSTSRAIVETYLNYKYSIY